MKPTTETLNKIWQQVPPDYYQKGIENNLLQRFWHYQKLKNVCEMIDNNPKAVLDVGCASGWLLFEIAKNYPKAQCTGIDVYKKALEYASKAYKKIKFIEADAHKLPFSDQSFDLIICTEVLEHVQDPKGVLQEIKRVLKPGGVVIAEMDTNNLLFRLIWFFWTRFKGRVWKDSHLHQFNRKRIKKMIINSGLRILKQKFFNFRLAVVFKMTH